MAQKCLFYLEMAKLKDRTPSVVKMTVVENVKRRNMKSVTFKAPILLQARSEGRVFGILQNDPQSKRHETGASLPPPPKEWKEKRNVKVVSRAPTLTSRCSEKRAATQPYYTHHLRPSAETEGIFGQSVGFVPPTFWLARGDGWARWCRNVATT